MINAMGPSARRRRLVPRMSERIPPPLLSRAVKEPRHDGSEHIQTRCAKDGRWPISVLASDDDLTKVARSNRGYETGADVVLPRVITRVG